MTENGSKARPVRTLTVKNFSVIKDAKLEFGKITVLIGPQASGKSLLCKLAFFFVQRVQEVATGTLLLRMPLDQCAEALRQEFLDHFPEIAWTGQEFHISYESDMYSLSVQTVRSGRNPVFEFHRGFPERYAQWIESHPEEGTAKPAISSIKSGELIPDIPIQPEGSIYIPTGRAFFSTPNKGFASVSGKNLDWITQRFSTEMDFDYKALIESSDPSSDLLPQFLDVAAHILNGKVIREGGILLFQSNADGRKLPFQLLSSGTLELLPLLNPLANLVFNLSTNPLWDFSRSSPIFGPIFVEEPELSVFPKTQYDLMRLVSWIAAEPRLGFQFAITTHSPYILTAFNNLIEAGQAARNNPKLHDQIAKIIPGQYWIKEGDFKAYAIEEGRLKSILNESGFVEGNYLDQVSEVIGNEFDELLRLEYEHTKAS
ncbi:MAG: AAA family ATPase [Terracidiphilus sp.]